VEVAEIFLQLTMTLSGLPVSLSLRCGFDGSN
jgi:hypothetical protein